MMSIKNLNVDLDPYDMLIERKYFPYFIYMFEIFSFISILILLDHQNVKREKRSIKLGIFLCFITAFNVGLSIFFILLYFNISL
ncbi:conserved Plasmodium protein, unknown function [Plasmodium gallinaceum]|uniref:Dolichyl-diphosphooligosaccharide-protein glycosyltransferase subunit OST5 n=1 Tax=Plasmodium gallinaceum TaxID=5849 RepID=A0A1J1GWX0_PLAGA|nr:conserved Plasmodium protein, unknown function [Plasmodium gallinaceum]CRG97059.1 conserved Plasmodium protein, unknown function [Plasmodium gallinaceum]